jgi:hypothetical protein
VLDLHEALPHKRVRGPTASHANSAWIEIVAAATDLIASAKLIGLTDNRELPHVKLRRSATVSCMWPPVPPGAPAPGRPATPGCALNTPGARHKPSRPRGPAHALHLPNSSHPRTDDENAPGVWESAPEVHPATRNIHLAQST